MDSGKTEFIYTVSREVATTANRTQAFPTEKTLQKLCEPVQLPFCSNIY